MFPYQELKQHLDLDIASAHGGAGFISSDMSLASVQALALRESFFKKLEPNGSSPAAIAAALEKFKCINSAISDTPFDFSPQSEHESLFWDYFRDNVARCLSPSDVVCDLDFLRSHMAVGPGSSLGCDNSNIFSKMFGSRISVTSPYLLALFRAAIVDTGLWCEAERLRHLKFGESIVSGNRLFFVPKNTEISRTCCTEPYVNMLVQQGVGAFMEVCLARSFGINLATQPDFNRELARIGSIDGSFGTIDLQSASDSISWALVQCICPPALLGLISQARCSSTTLPSGEQMTLRMVSTMGNGFTFPLQTIIFASAVRAVYQLQGLDSGCPRTQFGVFGDDIIVQASAYTFVCRMLAKLGFKVNDTKSFNSGSFRESCGYDWYNGHFVRGVYIRTLETVSDVYSAVNRLNRWSASTGVALSHTIAYLMRFFPRKAHIIPFSEGIDEGYQVPFKLTVPSVSNRYWFRYRKLACRPRKVDVPVSNKEASSLNHPHFCEIGWGALFLGAYARNEEISYKPNGESDLDLTRFGCTRGFITPRVPGAKPPRKVIRCEIPFWNWLGSDQPTDRFEIGWEAYVGPARQLFSFSDWEVAVTGNHHFG